MKTKFILLFLFIYSSYFLQSKEKEALDSIFNQTRKIEIYAYLDYNKWEKNDKKEIIYNNDIYIKDEYVRNKILLTKKQIKKLEKSLLKTKVEIDERADCFDPRHTIVFFNNHNKILGFINLCFSCLNSDSSKNLAFLSDKMLLQANLFKDFGITYFEETKEEREEFKEKRDKFYKELDEKLKKDLQNNN